MEANAVMENGVDIGSSSGEPINPGLERQRELEDSALALGAERFRKRLVQAQSSGKASTVGAAKKLLQEGLDPLTAAIKDFIGTKRRGRKHLALKYAEALGADAAAYLTLRTVLDHITRTVPVRKTATEIAVLMLDELKYRRFKKEAPQLYEYRLNRFTTSNYAHMARSMDQAISYAQIDTSDLELNQADLIIIGVKFVDLLVSSTGLAKVETKIVGRNENKRTPHKETFLAATEETLAWMSERNSALEHAWPINLPMVVPPLPWGPGKRGGYRYGLRGRHPLVRGVSKVHAETIRKAEMPTVYSALNRIQETPWKINQRILGFIQQISDQGGGIAGIPEMQPLELPSRPPDIDTNEEARKDWRKRAHAVHEANHQRRLKSLEFIRVLHAAQQVTEYDAIWFPCNLDFRGRVYPVVNYLHPQGDDLSKALLTFSQGKPLGPDGVGWLALHGANCLGETPEGLKLSKQTLQERVNWIVEHSVQIIQVAQDPMSDLWWAKADDPLQFVAFCLEWAGFVEADARGMGEQYVCSLPCAMDGTCNGLQHFAAMLLDPIGGEAVNVLATDRPQDIYQRIADVVLERLQKEAVDSEHARLWLKSGLVNRKLTKRPTMTFGYGSKKFGFKKQLEEYLAGLDNYREILSVFGATEKSRKGELPPACTYMSGLIWDALGDVVVAASQGMEWMQQAARLVVKTGKCVEWVVPGTGFPVRQEYFVEKTRRIETTLAGGAFRPQVFDAQSEPHPKKQANAVAPNFVHSLDAAALMLTVLRSSNDGVEQFGMVHDSYSTVPTDCPVLAGCTRQAFYELYTKNDVIGSLATQLETQAVANDNTEQAAEVVEFPSQPTKGSLDLGAVLASDYFFS